MYTMPTLSSLAILFLFSFSFHACHGRNLGVTINDVQKKEIQHLNKTNDQNGTISASSKVQPSLSREHEVVENNNAVEEIRVHGYSQKQNDLEKTITSTSEPKDQRVRSKDHDSLVSVSWQIPRKNNKPGDQNPGFNLDYSPPKTHPPSHN